MGSILHHPDGRFIAQWIDGAGNKRQKTLRAQSESAAEREGRRLLADLERRADRQHLGLEPLVSAADVTLGGLLDYWWERKRRKLRSHTVHGFLEKHLGPLREVPAIELTTSRLDALLAKKDGALAAESVNKLRARLTEIFKLASKAGGPWEGRPNPVADTEKRRVLRQLPRFLQVEEVTAVLEQLQGQERQVIATAVHTGMRKGEIGGLLKADVHLDAGEIWLQRCWDGAATKDGKPVVIPIHPDLLPVLTNAIEASPSELVFPRPGPDGSMHRPDVAWDKKLRAAMALAGLVKGYQHRCRAHGCRYREERREATPAPVCPRCGKPSTWAKAIPEHMTFKDLRHTAATLLLKAGVPLATVQRILRHSDPKLTSEIYGHLEVDDMRQGLARLSFRSTGAAPPPPSGAPGAPAAEVEPSRAPANAAACVPVRPVRLRALSAGALGVQVVAGSNPVAPTI